MIMPNKGCWKLKGADYQFMAFSFYTNSVGCQTQILLGQEKKEVVINQWFQRTTAMRNSKKTIFGRVLWVVDIPLCVTSAF